MKSLMVVVSLLLFNNIFGQEQKNYTKAIKEIFPDYEHPKVWIEPFPSFRIVGNLYGVGSYDLSTFIITSDQGQYDSAYINRNSLQIDFNKIRTPALKKLFLN